MSSSQGHCADCSQVENPPRRDGRDVAMAGWRAGVLAGVVILAAMGLAMASRFDQPSSGEAFAVAPELSVDPNTAPARVLTALPHVGPTLVREWVAARNDRPFSSLEDARHRVRGLGPATLAQIAPYLRFEPSTQSDADHIASSSSDRPVGKPRVNPAKAGSLKINEADTPIVPSSACRGAIGTASPATAFGCPA